jgi:hypothetical protein
MATSQRKLQRRAVKRRQRSSSKRRRINAAHRKYLETHVVGDKMKYCTGCGKLFARMHDMLNHRRGHRCGGKFLELQNMFPYDPSYRRIRDLNANTLGTDKLPRVKHKGRIPGQPKHIDIFDADGNFICNSRNKYRYKQWRRSASL